MEKIKTALQIRLSTMMFFQYMMFAVWWIPLAAYLANLGLNRGLTALILSSMAFGSVISPLVGMLADRYFNTKYLLAFLNVMVGIMLLFAASTTQPVFLFIFMLLIMLFYMPTWALTSSIALTSAPSDLFARIRVWGTFGWILAGIFSFFYVHQLDQSFDGTVLPFYFGSALSFITALFNFTLPDSLPGKSEKTTSLLDIMGFRSIVMMKNRNFKIFLLILFFSQIPFAMYWSYFSEYLNSVGYELITVTMSTGQVIELLVLFSVPFFIRKIGLRKTMVLGLIALVIRYGALFLAGNEANLGFVLVGAGVHGMIFGFFHLGGQIYTSKKAPSFLQAQAQGLIFFVTFAPGLLVGNFICGWIIGFFSTHTNAGINYQWDMIWGVTALMSLIVLLAFVLLFKNEKFETIEVEKTSL